MLITRIGSISNCFHRRTACSSCIGRSTFCGLPDARCHNESHIIAVKDDPLAVLTNDRRRGISAPPYRYCLTQTGQITWAYDKEISLPQHARA